MSKVNGADKVTKTPDVKKQTTSGVHLAQRVYDVLDMIPGVSNIVNLAIIIQKLFIALATDDNDPDSEPHEYTYVIENRNSWECLFLAFGIPPFAQLFIYTCRKQAELNEQAKLEKKAQDEIKKEASSEEIHRAVGIRNTKWANNNCFADVSMLGFVHNAKELIEEKKKAFFEDREGLISEWNQFKQDLSSFVPPVEKKETDKETDKKVEKTDNETTSKTSEEEIKETPKEEKPSCWSKFFGGLKKVIPFIPTDEEEKEKAFFADKKNSKAYGAIKIKKAFFELYDALVDAKNFTSRVPAKLMDNLRWEIYYYQKRQYESKLAKYNEDKKQFVENQKNDHAQVMSSLEEGEKTEFKETACEEQFDKDHSSDRPQQPEEPGGQEDSTEFSRLLRNIILGEDACNFIIADEKSIKRNLEVDGNNVVFKETPESKNKELDNISYPLQDSQKDVDSLKFEEEFIKNITTTKVENFNKENAIALLFKEKDIETQIKSLKDKTLEERLEILTGLMEKYKEVLNKKDDISDEIKIKWLKKRESLYQIVLLKVLIKLSKKKTFTLDDEDFCQLDRMLRAFCAKDKGLFVDKKDYTLDMSKALDAALKLGQYGVNFFASPEKEEIIAEESLEKIKKINEEIELPGLLSCEKTTTHKIKKDSPFVLFEINRFNSKGVKVNTPVAVPVRIEFETTEGENKLYERSFIVIHSGGTSIDGGHYYAYLFKDGRVFRYDDMNHAKEITGEKELSLAQQDWEEKCYQVFYTPVKEESEQVDNEKKQVN